MNAKPSINSNLTGTLLRKYETEISWRKTMNYAAAVGDANPVFFDDESESGIIAHPLFPVAVTWNILGSIKNFIDSDEFPVELLFTQVHYTEHLEIHKPVTPGQKITINGRIAAMLPHRAGTHVIIRLDAIGADGGPLFTEHIGAMLRGVECIGSSGEDQIPSVPELKDEFRLIRENRAALNPLLPFIYDGCTDIIFPIHTSKKFAHQVGLPDIIVQGTATLAVSVSELVKAELGNDPTRVKKISCRFTGMVLQGTDISVKLTGREETENGVNLFFEVINSRGERVIGNGYICAE